MGCALTDIGTFWTNHSERGQSRFLSQSVMAKSGNRTAHSPSPSHIMTHYAKTTNSLGIQIELIELTESFFFLWNVRNIDQRDFVEFHSPHFSRIVYSSKILGQEKAFKVAKISPFGNIFFKI